MITSQRISWDIYKAYYRLMKPNVMSLVAFTAFVGMILAPGHVHWAQGFTYLFCIMLAAGASAAINMGYDHDIDSIMRRTQNRPTVQGIIPPQEAILFGIVLGTICVLTLASIANFTAAFWLAFTIIFYDYVYTVCLKRLSDQNIVIGGLAGALPPLIGWSCVSPHFHPLPWIMVLVIFLWTPPHFWSLSLYTHQDYRSCKVPMLVVTVGLERTRWWILLYTMILTIPVALPYVLGYMGIVYLYPALLLHGLFLWYGLQLNRNPTEVLARQTFFFSIIYLFSLFLFMWADFLIT